MTNIPERECSHCLPDCTLTIYKASVSAVPYRRCDNKNQNLEETVTSLKSNLKKVKDSMGNSIKQLTSSTEEEKGKLEMLSHELKVELEVQMEEKGMLALEVKKLRGALERRDQQEKQRKLLLMNEFR